MLRMRSPRGGATVRAFSLVKGNDTLTKDRMNLVAGESSLSSLFDFYLVDDVDGFKLME